MSNNTVENTNTQNTQSNMSNTTKEYKHSKGQYFTKDPTLQKCVVNFIKNDPKVILEPSMGRGDLVECVSKNMNVVFDTDKPDGQYRKTVSCEKMLDSIGDFKFTKLEDGVKKVYNEVIKEYGK